MSPDPLVTKLFGEISGLDERIWNELRKIKQRPALVTCTIKLPGSGGPSSPRLETSIYLLYQKEGVERVTTVHTVSVDERSREMASNVANLYLGFVSFERPHEVALEFDCIG